MIGSAPDWDAVYRDRVQSALAVRSGGVDQPLWIFVCGQQGSSKSSHVAALVSRLGPECTQRIDCDAIIALLPELSAPAQSGILWRFIDRLVDHATALGAHVVWELPSPGRIEGLAMVARGIGYRVECRVLALPAEESWLATLGRGLAGLAAGDETVPLIPWDKLCSTYRRWPALLARAEAAGLFDSILVLDREGEICFQTERQPSGDFSAPPFAFESLVIERARARPATQRAALLAEWQAILAHPLFAFRNQPAWPWDSVRHFDRRLRALCDDPASGFDLNQPQTTGGPSAAAGWVKRLRLELDQILAVPEASGQPALPARCDRLVALVRQVAGLRDAQPIR